MESFELKGDNGSIKIRISELFGFPDQTCHLGGYDCCADIEINIPNYSAKGYFYTSTGEIYTFYEALKKSQREIQGEAQYLTLEDNLELKVSFFKDSGHASITGRFQQLTSVGNYLMFEISTDQSFLKYTVDQLELLVNKYGDNQGIKK